MKIAIKATKFNLTPSIKKAIKEKMLVLSKFIFYPENLIKVFIEVALETRHHKKGEIYYAEANIEVPGKIFRAEARKENLYQAINELKKELQRILKKDKEKRIVKRNKVDPLV